MILLRLAVAAIAALLGDGYAAHLVLDPERRHRLDPKDVAEGVKWHLGL